MHLIKNNVDPRHILAITFTNKAANEMKERVANLTDVQNRSLLSISTFHALGRKILSQHAQEAGLPKNFHIISQREQIAIIKKILTDDLKLPKHTDSGPSPRAIAAKINNAKEARRRSNNTNAHYFSRLEEISSADIQECYEIYEKRCHEIGGVDFAELLLGSCELLANNKKIRSLWSKKFKHILVDELQDINNLQFLLLEQLSSKDTVFFGVGDDDQSIYKFRGAQPDMLNIFLAKLVKSKQIIKLEQNYRSTNAILNLANAVISQNFDRLEEKKLFSSNQDDGEQPVLTAYTSDEEEANEVANQITSLFGNNIAPSSICVMYRNHALSQLIEEALSRKGIAYTIRGGQPFFERAEILDLIAYLKVAANINDNLAIARSVNSPPRRAVKAKQLALTSQQPVWRQIVDMNQPGTNMYLDLIEKIQQADTDGNLVEAVKTAVDDSGLIQYFEKRKEHDRIENLNELINVVTRYAQQNPDADLADYLSEISLDTEFGHVQTEQNISLMTIHSAKGLEFEHVFLIGLEQGILPSPHEDTDLNEERRLLYVAITRAMKNLYLSYTRYRMHRGRGHTSHPSLFLKNLKEQLSVKKSKAPTFDDLLSNQSRRKYSPRQNNNKFVAPKSFSFQKLGGYQTGQKIKHPRLGEGMIVSLDGSNDRMKAEILFRKNKQKRWLDLTQAKLEKIS